MVYHSSGCGCLSDTFISKAHTNFTSILIEAQSQDEFVRRVKALPRHAVDDHSQCDYHPLVVCSCGACENKDQISCQGKPYRTKFRLDCKFHALLYEIECHARAKQVKELIHPVLKRGHSNAVEASHNVFIRFRSKDISLGRLHYHVSTNLALLQANLTYMHAKFGISYHWIPDLYRRMKLPVFDGVQEALEKHNLQCKRKLEREKTTPVKKRRIELKKRRVFGVQSGVVVMHMVRMVSMNLTMLRYLNAKGARLSQGKPNQKAMACVVLVGLQLTSVGHTEIVLSTLNVPLQKQVPSLLL